jgi:hypothetical protein
MCEMLGATSGTRSHMFLQISFKPQNSIYSKGIGLAVCFGLLYSLFLSYCQLVCSRPPCPTE